MEKISSALNIPFAKWSFNDDRDTAEDMLTGSFTKGLSMEEDETCDLNRSMYGYPITALGGYLERLRHFQGLLKAQIDYISSHLDHSYFRNSDSKKQMECQAVPINLHLQVLSIHEAPDPRNLLGIESEVHHSDMVTCGAAFERILRGSNG